jgi:nucleoside-diphosphate-sugar epimerase
MDSDLVVVVGGTGFLGSRIALAMAAQDCEVVVASRHPPPDGIALDALNFTSFATPAWRDVVGRATHVVLCVGSALPGQSLTALRPHTDGIQALMENLRDARSLCRVVLVSSVLAYGDVRGRVPVGPIRLGQTFRSPYAFAKYRSETIVEDSGIPFRVVRPGLLLGDSRSGEISATQPAVELIRHALRLPVLPIEEGGGFTVWIAPVDLVVEDVCRATFDEDAARVIVSADPDSPTLAELLEALTAPFGSLPLIVDPGRRVARSWWLRRFLDRCGVPGEWHDLARPWAELDREELRRLHLGDTCLRPGYVHQTALYANSLLRGTA